MSRTDGTNLAQETGGNLDKIATGVAPATDTSTTGTIQNDQDAVTLTLAGGQGTGLIQVSGTLKGTINFEVSPDAGANWYALTMNAVGTSTLGSSAVVDGSGGAVANAYRGNIAGFNRIRVRLHPVTSGIGTVTIVSSAEPHNVTVNNATALGQAVMASSAPVVIASDQSDLAVRSDILTVTGGGAVNGVNTFAIPATDLANYRYISLQLAGTWAATLVWEWSNDNVNWNGGVLNQINAYTPANNIGSTTFNQQWVGAVQGRYFRVRASAYTSNASMAATLIAWTLPTAQYMYSVNAIAIPQSSGGTSVSYVNSAASTNSTNVKGSGGQIYGYDFGNNGAADAYVKLYNKATAPTVGTDTPFLVIYVPKGTRVFYTSECGMPLGTGIGYGITGGAANSDTTAVAVNQVVGFLEYK